MLCDFISISIAISSLRVENHHCIDILKNRHFVPFVPTIMFSSAKYTVQQQSEKQKPNQKKLLSSYMWKERESNSKNNDILNTPTWIWN
jgi:hypothetical protein